MGSALSRCSSRDSGRTTGGLSDIGQKFLDRQPNWLNPPSKWPFSHHASSRQPTRYRAPTPYPTDDRKPLEEPPKVVSLHIPEKAIVNIETTSASHIEHAQQQHRKPASLTNTPKSIVAGRKPVGAVSITWDVSPRLNRFERVR
ncbi:hypothetical protein VTJ04DRAFT_6070 [Mycothermus thermophilus]|jgi:hypothetical protein|uniref:uncharacterized protein n=1 Tax=Humicola insolens TaxID=85995 RepID=UPI0037427B23